ncbi:MAG: hypothetical protein K2V38_26705 [Gemmataceae bacterium]|nr:hypothetical protein [Gemmataceae bacterium]
MGKSAQKLYDRCVELHRAEYHYDLLVDTCREIGKWIPRSEFAHKLDPAVVAEFERVLEEEIRPQLQAASDEFVAAFGIAWEDRVSVENPGEPPVRLAPWEVTFALAPTEPFGTLRGHALKADGTPGKKIVVVRLRPGISKVTVLSSAAKPA